ncbi:MAG TPA: nitrate reductase molybdenum cofactor assembly chaperone [Kineosporiaceae bacterium]|nr:nitrate reductase molybdenum cofactor assembly chaperone [Kineosporiaceae bacterium]
MTGPSEHAVVLQAASVLLQYPDARVRAALPAVRAALETLPRGLPLRRLLDLVGHLETTPAGELEERYVAVLDRKRKCCLYLTWWTDGETRRRGLALARLKQIYRSRGVELLPQELPDYLPVVLEFAATADVGLGLQVLQEHRAGLELLRLALLEAGTEYVAALEAVCALLPGVSPADEAAARALARNGPPGELVGMDGYGGLGDAVGPTSLRSTSPAAAGGGAGGVPFVPLESLGVRR